MELEEFKKNIEEKFESQIAGLKQQIANSWEPPKAEVDAVRYHLEDMRKDA